MGVRRTSILWRQGRLTGSDLRTIEVILALEAFTRGFDLAAEKWASGVEYQVLFSSFPPQVWGIAFLIGSATLLGGILLKVHQMVWFGHIFLAIVLTAYAAGMILAFTSTVGFRSLRAPSVVLFSAILHILFALRTGPHPVGPRKARRALRGGDVA